MSGTAYNVLFLCTGNSARSILSEAALIAQGGARFNAYSAGSQPTGAVNPYALALLEKLGRDTGFARSKSWDEFSGPQAPQMDFIFTVCDNAANETCPIWPGHPMSTHWGVPDPAAASGTDAQIAAEFARAYEVLSGRVQQFVDLPLETMDAAEIKSRIRAIGTAT